LDPYLGEIRLLGFGFAPRGWRLCDGSLLPIQSNTALFSLLGAQYGGNGVNNFALPDLRGRSPVHFGTTYPQGTQAGTETVSLSLAQLPAHNHTLMGTTATGDGIEPNSHAYATVANAADFKYAPDSATTALNPAVIQNVGGGQPHDNMQPFLVMNYCIALTGIFPSRN